jgi:LAO/AO transport system kinase
MTARPYTPSTDLVVRIENGAVPAVARLISRAEAGSAEAREALGDIYRKAGRAHVVGITGVPGSGKSTLVARLASRLREQDKRVAIIAIDPSSPYSGGSILGDRIRMSELGTDPGIFIRSMATHGAVGGMAHAALDVVDILDVAGFDVVIIETVGVGQDEVEIANASHTTVVVSPPGLGDEVQAMKAGILEVADIHVVSKCDRPDSNRTITDLKMMLRDQRPRDGTWRSPVVGVSSVSGDGFDDLLAALDRHRDAIAGDAGQKRRTAIASFRLTKTAETLALEAFRKVLAEKVGPAACKLSARAADPYETADAIVRDFTGKGRDV